MVFLGDRSRRSPRCGWRKTSQRRVPGRPATRINLKGVDRVIVCTALADKVMFRQCAIKYKKSGTRMPRAELQEMAQPDFKTARHQERRPTSRSARTPSPRWARRRRTSSTIRWRARWTHLRGETDRPGGHGHDEDEGAQARTPRKGGGARRSQRGKPPGSRATTTSDEAIEEKRVSASCVDTKRPPKTS